MKMQPCLAQWSVRTVPGAVKCPLLTLQVKPWMALWKPALALRNTLPDLGARECPRAVHIERMDTMEDFELQEQRLSDAQAFDTLVLQISRIGGRNTKDCVHKVLDRWDHAIR
ncbi:uncharacterized protein Hap1MRO34_021136 [Clarias gariepinus]